MSDAKWTFFTNHAHVLFCLADRPQIRLREVADKVGITERAVQRIVADLRDEGYIEIEKQGRRNHYKIRRGEHLRHDIESHCTLEDILTDVLTDD
ncbi:MAG: helix-turn-helix transcriptional regulator [Myxococcota bacterium]